MIPQSIILGQGNVAAGLRLAARTPRRTGSRLRPLAAGPGEVDGTDVQVIGIDPDAYLKVAAFD